jgi:alpha-ketoglutarate-dependent taurine dioxygenase
MSITIYPITPNFAAEIGDVDLTRLSDAEFAEIQSAFWKYAMLIFPGQSLTQDQHPHSRRASARSRTSARSIRRLRRRATAAPSLTSPTIAQGVVDL